MTIKDRLELIIKKCEDFASVIKNSKTMHKADIDYFLIGINERIKAGKLILEFENASLEQKRVLMELRKSIEDRPPGIIVSKDCDKLQNMLDTQEEIITQEVEQLEKTFNIFYDIVCEEGKLN